jgi:integral membrane sensor domain MASE1
MFEEIIEVFAEGFERLQNAFNIVMKAGDICCALTAIVGVTSLILILIYLKRRRK